MITNNYHIQATSRLFSSTIFREMAAKGRSGIFVRLLRQAMPLESISKLHVVSDAFDAAFSTLKSVGNRDEYIYKAALTHRVLLGTHTLRTACMLAEFRVGQCKADLAILNGTSTVYEIKSERDSLSRLQRQIEAYKKVFARVFVIVGENHIQDALAATSEDIGVMRLSRRYQISTVRNAADSSDRICPIAVFESMRTAEARQILVRLGVRIPQLPNTMLRAALRERFNGLPAKEVHDAMVQTLRRSRNLTALESLVERLPASLHAAALSVPVRRSDHGRLIAAMNTPLQQAMEWV